MKEKVKIPSRRALLHLGVRSLAGAGLLGTLEHAAGAATDDRALVCIYHFGGEGGSYLPNVAELKALHRKEVLAVVRDVAPLGAKQYEALRFLPNGFATLEWAARKASVQPLTGAGAFTFQSGMSLVSFDGREREGEQFENAALRQAMRNIEALSTNFPDTSVGRQLEDVSRLLGSSRELGLRRPVFVCTVTGFTSSAHRAGLLGARYREVGQALAAFYAATIELGLERKVTTYTDGEFPLDRTARRSSRLILGGAAAEDQSFDADTYSDSLVSWHGLQQA
jgi:uncharacterized protein (DUF1501 family)